jgi:hypothetical protein
LLLFAEGTWQGRCTQFAAADGFNDPAYCVPYSNLSPVEYTYQITYSGFEVTSVQNIEAEGGSDPIVSKTTFTYPRVSYKGNATFTAYAGINSNLFQACVSVSLEQYGEASYLAGLSHIDGTLVYNEEGYWSAPSNVPTSQCKTESPQRLYCSDPGEWNYICQMTKLQYVATPLGGGVVNTPPYSKPPKPLKKHKKHKKSSWKLLL